jgi:hypothetical protein
MMRVAAMKDVINISIKHPNFIDSPCVILDKEGPPVEVPAPKYVPDQSPSLSSPSVRTIMGEFLPPLSKVAEMDGSVDGVEDEGREEWDLVEDDNDNPIFVMDFRDNISDFYSSSSTCCQLHLRSLHPTDISI